MSFFKYKSLLAKIISLTLCLCLILTICPPQQAQALTVTAQGAILIDAATGKVLFEQNANTKLYPASTTKIMTAMLVLEHLKLTDKITVPPDFINPGEAGIWLAPGEVQTVEDMLMALMLRSANDAAELLAIACSGSVEKFADLMNEKVKELGLHNTNFVSPHGLHNENHYTTAYDLAQIARAACQNPEFNKLITTKRHQLPWVVGDYDRVVYNRNELLDRYAGADGIKTGYTKEAGSCLVSSATKNGMRLIGVVLNSQQMYDTSAAMLDYGFATYNQKLLAKKEQIFGKVPINFGHAPSVEVMLSKNLTMVLPKASAEKSPIEPTVQLPEIVEAPITKGQVIGTVTYTDADGFAVTADLVATADVARRDTLLQVIKQVWHALWRVFTA